MKRLLPVVALVLAISAGDVAAWASPKLDPSQFTVNMHVSKSYLEVLPDRPLNSVAQRLDVTIDGHHLVLDGRSAVGRETGGAVPDWRLQGSGKERRQRPERRVLAAVRNPVEGWLDVGWQCDERE
jgi:hypothetical protein